MTHVAKLKYYTIYLKPIFLAASKLMLQVNLIMHSVSNVTSKSASYYREVAGHPEQYVYLYLYVYLCYALLVQRML